MNSRERFGKACRCEPVDRPPVWLMRQAGRYLPEYQEMREKYSFLDICRKPDLSFEISMQPWRRFGMDAVILFSDILIPTEAMGMRLEFREDKGPTFKEKIISSSDLNRLSKPHVRRSLSSPLETIESLRQELGDSAALIGFTGAPWTLACYMTEGGSGDFSEAINFIKSQNDFFFSLMSFISDTIAEYAIEQVHAGADAVQIFDTWAGLLEPQLYEDACLPFIKKIVRAIKNSGGVPIFFIRDSENALKVMRDSGAEVISVGSRTRLEEAWMVLGKNIATQGNLDPEILLGPPANVVHSTFELLERVKNRDGHIINLGHGILPGSNIRSVKALVDTVISYGRRPD